MVNELKEAVTKAIKKPNGHPGSSRDNLNRLYHQVFISKALTNTITIATSEGFVVLHTRDIIYCQASNNYTIIHLADKKKNYFEPDTGLL
ncbi:MAG: hypothetical protein WDO16_18185 [Bacteroidota bacterium]